MAFSLLRRQLRVEALEDRLLLAQRIWNGNGTTNNWADRFNWVGNIAPAANDDLVFPQNAARKTSQIVNVPIGTLFNSITYEGSGYSVLSSNTIALRSLTASNT